jgi:hypothetical protein
MSCSRCETKEFAKEFYDTKIEELISHLEYNGITGYEYVTKSNWRFKLVKLKEKNK